MEDVNLSASKEKSLYLDGSIWMSITFYISK